MPVETHIYDEQFFKNTIKFEADSAAQFVAVLLKYYQPQSVVDIGCGAGIYLQALADRGIKDLLGIDGAPASASEFLLAPDKLIIFDLATKYNFSKTYDLALCLEVAEHLRAEDADVLVDTIGAAADKIIFTAAVPGQGPRSIGHINEQAHEYWIEKFAARGFKYLEERTLTMREEMKAGNVVWWIVNNLMIFEK